MYSTCNTVLLYRNYFGSRTNMVSGPTGGALSREYNALRRVVGAAVRQSIVCRYVCRRNVSEVCVYLTYKYMYMYFHVCVAHSNLKTSGGMS
jgi:hypothetical protein